jgi:hypothetical protein
MGRAQIPCGVERGRKMSCGSGGMHMLRRVVRYAEFKHGNRVHARAVGPDL